VTAQQAGVGLGHSTLGGQVSPYAQMAAAFGAPGVFGLPQAAMIDPTIVARQQAMQALMSQWAMGGLGHTSLPFGSLQGAYAQAIPGFVPQAIPGVYGVQGYPGVIGWQQPVAAGLGHSTVRSPVVELLYGAFDPTLRQVEYARAHEANRAWELGQGLSHTTSPFAQASIFANPLAQASIFGNGAFTAYNPFVNSYGTAAIYGR